MRHCSPKPWVVGHSYGGWVTLHAAKAYGDELGGVVTVDSAVLPPELLPDKPWQPPPRKAGAPSAEALLARFKLMPEQPVENGYLVDYIGPQSIRKEGGLYVWKDDLQRFMKAEPHTNFRDDMSKMLRFLKCRLAIMYGEKSEHFADGRVLRHMQTETQVSPPGGEQYTPIIGIPEAHHHIMFDQPLQLIVALRSVLAEWQRQSEVTLTVHTALTSSKRTGAVSAPVARL
eukprot:CAMPEP_0172942180 /NCGR_PEP_ID=MMETSP1075-20121228/224916_1 /TAXON_ID=2916 /ORGANISM="Ceratium fusus, Strain PA161109" /LENGTH=229 /DNA_ID=CAMNT_0013803601 /DNA_START=433 /DNA_END=1122 /DNA_ORIENTATION=-